MNEKITANLSLTKEKWGLLVLMVLSSAPHLPNTLWCEASDQERKISP